MAYIRISQIYLRLLEIFSGRLTNSALSVILQDKLRKAKKNIF